MTTIHQVAEAPNPGILLNDSFSHPHRRSTAKSCQLHLWLVSWVCLGLSNPRLPSSSPRQAISPRTAIIPPFIGFFPQLLIPWQIILAEQWRSALYVCPLKFCILKQFRITENSKNNIQNFHIFISKISQMITFYICFSNLSHSYAIVSRLHIHINIHIYIILYCYFFLTILWE